MKQRIQSRGLTLLLALILALGLAVSAGAVSDSTVDAAITDTAQYIYQTVKNPQVGSIGGEWAVLGLARSGYSVPETYYQDYYDTVEAYVKSCKGVLHEKKYTEYARVSLALTAIGKEPTDVAGYNLLTALGDYDKTIWQGMNGPIWALIALDSGDYAIPVNQDAATQATRQLYIDRILACQLSDGGWSLLGGTASASSGDGTSDPDITGMALQALAKYQDQPAVKKATDEALACMSKQQNTSGGFASGSTTSSESCVQMLVALCELGISVDDARFVKNGNTIADNLMTFYRARNGFQHTADGAGSSQMATEQGLYGLVALARTNSGKNSLYRMSDALQIGTSAGGITGGAGLEGKHADVKAVAITAPGTTFSDIASSENRVAVETLASRGIINGKGEDLFDPNASMTRAEFAAIVVRALGLTPKANSTFTDVTADKWYASYIGAANTYGIVNGTTATTFYPDGTITRQEAAVMVARAAELCGMRTAYDSVSARDVLAQFSDYVRCADWARSGLAFCYDQAILEDSAINIEPAKAIRRGDIAQMLYHLLGSAKLL